MSIIEHGDNDHDECAILREHIRIEDTLLKSVSWICHYYNVGISDAVLVAGLPCRHLLSPSMALSALETAGFSCGLVERQSTKLPLDIMPMIILRHGKGGCVLLGREKRDRGDNNPELVYRVIMPEISNDPVEISHEELDTFYSGYAIFVKPLAKFQHRSQDELPEPRGHWLLSSLWRYRRYYRSAVIATVLINVLALASIFFTMNVYDRVIPNQAFTTLWSLAIGVSLAMLFEAIARYIRVQLIDEAGKKVDLVVGGLLFKQALAVRMEHKPASSGNFASQLREFESVRDFVSSATLAALSDIPFILLFLFIIFVVGGPLAWVPFLMLPIITLVSIIIQWPLAKIMKENLKDAGLKQGVLIESIEGMETLKAVSGEGFMQRRWQNLSAQQSDSSMKSKRYSAIASGCVTFLQQLQTVVLIVYGVYLISDGILTMGALIATVMLASRSAAPLGQMIALAIRYQQAKVALCTLNKLMELPRDRTPNNYYLPNPEIKGEIILKDVCFSYPAPAMQPNPEILKDINIRIRPGERVAILGRIGSGKSTLLRLLARLYSPVKGKMSCDGLDINQIDPADWRKAVGYVGQESRLFYGTLKENVVIGQPDISAKEFLKVLSLCGLDRIAAHHPAGINLPIGENGEGLSGGQRQLVSLARTLLSNPEILLMDEPTSAMDTQTERHFLKKLEQATKGKTLVLVTHRPPLLTLVDRIIVVEDGQVVADGPKDIVMKSLLPKDIKTEKTSQEREKDA